MLENLQERPAFCDTPGLSKTSALASQCKPDSMGQVKPDRPDIRSKALTDTDEKKKRLKKLGLTHETFQRVTKRIREANLNDYVKKYQMKMGNKTSTVDKDAWVDGIGGLSKRETKTLKRQLQGHTREGETSVRKFKKGQPNPQLDPPRKEEVEDEGYVGTVKKKKSEKEHGYPNQNPKKDKYTGYVEGNRKTFAEITTRLIDELSINTLRRAGSKARKAADTAREDGGTQQGREEGRRKASKKDAQAAKFAAAVDVKQRNTAFKKEDVIDELSTGLLKRAASGAHKDMEKQKDYHDLAAFDGGRTEREKWTKKRAEKREKQATKFSAAAGEKPPKPESQDSRDKRLAPIKKKMYEVDSSGIDMYDHKRKESEMRKKARAVPTTPETLAKLKKARAGEVVDEKESDYADKIAAFKKKGGKIEKQKPGPISKSLFRTTVGREKRRNPGKQATRDTFYDEVEVKELGPIGAFVARAAIKHVAKKAIKKVTSKNEMMARSVGSQKKSRDKMFLARSRDNTIKKAEQDNVNELSKELLDRAAQGANRKADQQRDVSAKAASRVGDTSQPPGQNIKSKRAGYQAAKKDYQAFKFGIAAKKKEKLGESNKLQADMALSDAGIKSYWEDGKLWVDKKDVVKAEKTLSKSFKKGGEPHIYYKGGFLGVWNKKRKITGG